VKRGDCVDKLTDEKKYIYLGIPVLFLVGSLFHFLYDLTGQLTIIGAISPVNESVWEHCKMVVLPTILWWTIYYIAMAKKKGIDKNKWFTAALSSLVVSIITIPFIFYFYTNAFGIESLVVDIMILLIAVTLGQLAGFHIFVFGKGINAKISIALIIAILIIFIVFTFSTPHLPIFLDKSTGSYGI